MRKKSYFTANMKYFIIGEVYINALFPDEGY